MPLQSIYTLIFKALRMKKIIYSTLP